MSTSFSFLRLKGIALNKQDILFVGSNKYVSSIPQDFDHSAVEYKNSPACFLHKILLCRFVLSDSCLNVMPSHHQREKVNR